MRDDDAAPNLDALTVATLFGWQAAERLLLVHTAGGQVALVMRTPAASGSGRLHEDLAGVLQQLTERLQHDAADAEARTEPPPCPAQARELLDALRELGWSQARLARRLEIDPNTVSRWIVSGRVPGYAREYLRALVLVKRLARLLHEDR